MLKPLFICLGQPRERELNWWIANVSSSYFPLDIREPTIEFKTDASTTGGWGAVCNSCQTGGRWNSEEKQKHINVLEMLAIEYALKSFKGEVFGVCNVPTFDSMYPLVQGKQLCFPGMMSLTFLTVMDSKLVK